MPQDLETWFKTYAYSIMSGAVKQEYENCISQWGSYLELILGYAKTALERHRQVLIGIKKEMEKREKDEELAMIAFAFAGGMAASWVGATIEHKVVPRLLGKTEKTASYAVDQSIRDPARLRILPIYNKQSHNQVLAKLLGDTTGNLTEKLLVSPAIKASAPDPSALLGAINRVGESLTLHDFESSLRSALEVAKAMGGTAIMNYAGTILKDHEFGKKWLKQASDRQSRQMAQFMMRPIANPNTPDNLQTIGEALIREAIDAQRREWASRWFFYGNNVPTLNPIFAVNALEVEIWRVWILTEDFKRYKYRLFRDDATEQDEYRVKGRSGIDIDRILSRLEKLGVFKDKDERRVSWYMNRMQASQNGLLPVELDSIEGVVDTDAERIAVLDWAKNRQPQAIMGWGQGVPRSIDPIDPANIPNR